jgi:hypothetical protein
VHWDIRKCLLSTLPRERWMEIICEVNGTNIKEVVVIGGIGGMFDKIMAFMIHSIL